MSALIEVRDLKKYFKTPKGNLHAVDGVSFGIERGKTLGVVGESGCGKSTLGRVTIHLLEATSGRIFFEGKDISQIGGAEVKRYRQDMQMIFQDPYSSLDPRMSVSNIIAEPLRIYRKCRDEAELGAQVGRLMDRVGLARRLADAYPHELDGGRRQRIGVARALSLNPKFIVCDEPVSALDVSIQAQILNLMQDLQAELDLTFLFITHNMAVVKHISDEILVMYMGKMVESAPSGSVFAERFHPYTKALLAAVPVPVLGGKKERRLLKGEISSPVNPKPGCRFAKRCEFATELCSAEEPPFAEAKPGHRVACHHVKSINALA
ncbi:MAG TPA: ATP-binding cassette domain-containing protein [Spirochaetales bacterium]|nr:ATP-binding cassette domain-containing protein [Spirochaetales bacterium]HRY55060.1 ATP-binding cassette domain-containing protein [Spirochaetia bacterium]HRZ64225.1 ATP-binding cassette domain-containing protein [Spirochaetia bacterium]